MAITVTSLRTIVSTGASATQTSTLATTLTITPNPLTTAFEPPPYCTQSYLSNCQTDAVSGTYPCFVSVYPQGVCDSNGQSCYPPIPGVLDNTYLYSPGLSCPSGWSTAWKEVRTPTGDDEETTAHCCPTGLTVTTYGIYSTWCEGTVTSGEETMIVNGLSQCPASTAVFNFGQDPVQLSWLNADSTTMSISGTPVFTISAERVALLYRSSDVTAAGASSTAGSGSTGANSGSGSSGSAADSGLSAGAVAGIAIGAAAVGILLVSGLFWLCLRRRKSSHARAAHTQSGKAHPHAAGAHLPSQAPTGPVHELKAASTVSTPQVPADHVAPNATELLGSTPSDPRWAAVPQHGMNNHHGGGTLVPGEVSTSNDYHQLAGTFDRGQGLLDNSRQNTPINLVGHGFGGRGYQPEKN